MRNNGVIWITGLSGSGKTTLANSISVSLRLLGLITIHLDGDDLREALDALIPNQNRYSTLTRLSLATAYSKLASLLSNQNCIIIVSTISMYNKIHLLNREYIQNYFEIYLKISLETRKKRDAKHFYRNHAEGKITSIPGLDQGYEEPICPDITIHDDMLNFHEDYFKVVFEKIVSWLTNGT